MAKSTLGPKNQKPIIPEGLEPFYMAFEDRFNELNKRPRGRPEGSGIKWSEDWMISFAGLADLVKKMGAEDPAKFAGKPTSDLDVAILYKAQFPGSNLPAADRLRNLIVKGRQLKRKKETNPKS